jgi:DNA polymerase III sliding clamp (beta) subunit (PCNA family)
MKFRIEAAEWCKNLGFVMHALPALGKAEKIWSTGILIEASGDESNGVVRVMATDIKQIGMKNDMKATVEVEGRCLIPGQLQGLFMLLQKDGELLIDFDKESQNITVKTDYYEGHFPCLDEADFRVMGLDEDDAEAKKFDLPLLNLHEIVDLVAPSADVKDIEQGKSGVLLRCEQKLSEAIPGCNVTEMIGGRRVEVAYDELAAAPSKLVAAALDGKKMSKYEVTGLFDDIDSAYFAVMDNAQRPFEKVPHFEMMVPAGLLTTASRALSQLSQAKDMVHVSVFGGFITFRCGKSAVALRLLAAGLPNWRRVIARPSEFKLTVNSEDLRLASQIASMSNLTQKESPIIIHVKDGDVRVGNGVMNDDKSAREIRSVVQTEGALPADGLSIGLNYERFSQVLNYIKSEYVCLNFGKPDKCVLLFNCDVEQGNEQAKPDYKVNESFLAMIMPVSIS